MRLSIPILGLGGERQAFCVSCKTMRRFRDEPEIETTSNGRPQLAGHCAACGTRLLQFVSTGNPRQPRVSKPSIKVSAETKARVTQAAWFADVPQSDVIDWLVRVHIDELILRMGDAMRVGGVRPNPAQLMLISEARARRRPAESVPRHLSA